MMEDDTKETIALTVGLFAGCALPTAILVAAFGAVLLMIKWILL